MPTITQATTLVEVRQNEDFQLTIDAGTTTIDTSAVPVKVYITLPRMTKVAIASRVTGEAAAAAMVFNCSVNDVAPGDYALEIISDEDGDPETSVPSYTIGWPMILRIHEAYSL